MKYIFELNARTSLHESAEAKHNRVIDALKKIDTPWGIGKVDIPFPGFGTHFIATVNLNKYMGKGVKCSVFYRFRNMLEDDSSCDDRIYIEFNAKKVDYNNLISEIFPKYVEAFDAYRAIIESEDLMFIDFERMRSNPANRTGINLRQSVYRFYPVCFYDEQLCLKALNKSPADILKRLTGKIEHVEILNRGLFIKGSSSFFSIEEADALDLHISNLINGV